MSTKNDPLWTLKLGAGREAGQEGVVSPLTFTQLCPTRTIWLAFRGLVTREKQV